MYRLHPIFHQMVACFDRVNKNAVHTRDDYFRSGIRFWR